MITPDQKNYIESEDFIEGARCLELEVPWIVSDAVHQLGEILNKEDIVLEVGTGGSTIFYAKRCKGVIAIETNEDWFNKVANKMAQDDISNVEYHISLEDNYLHSVMKRAVGVTVFSVDTQGGIDRSAILDYFLKSCDTAKLRMIILDNYSHEGLYPEHHNRVMAMGYGWKDFQYNHPRWAGSGTLIYLKIK